MRFRIPKFAISGSVHLPDWFLLGIDAHTVLQYDPVSSQGLDMLREKYRSPSVPQSSFTLNTSQAVNK